MTNCPHTKFQAGVIVTRLEGKEGVGFVADVQVTCSQCLEPFIFMGMDRGLTFTRPMISVLGTEARLPIAPKSYVDKYNPKDEMQIMREALQVVCGHNQCYCEICKDISSRYWKP